jgi:hypothetical protein
MIAEEKSYRTQIQLEDEKFGQGWQNTCLGGTRYGKEYGSF